MLFTQWNAFLHGFKNAPLVLRSLWQLAQMSSKVLGFRAVLLYLGEVVFGVLPVLNLLVIERILSNLANPEFPLLAAGIAALVLIQVCSVWVSSHLNVLEADARDSLISKLKKDVLEAVSRPDSLAIEEDARQQERLVTAHQGTEHLWRSIEGSFGFVGSVAAVVGSLLVVVSIGWWIPLLLLVAVLPGILVKQDIERRTWNSEQLLADATRRRDLMEQVLIEPRHARETRFLGVGHLFLQRWERLSHDILQSMHQVRHQGARQMFWWSVPGALAMVYPYLHILQRVQQGTLGVGQVVLYFGVVQDLRFNLISLFYSVGGLMNAHLYLKAIEDFKAFQQPEHAEGFSVPEIQQLEFRNVSFRYANQTDWALKNVNFVLHKGERLLLAGPNGSGKTTLLKLLLGLYTPQEGQVLVNGQDLRTLDGPALREHFVGLFQDFARYPLSVQENICIGLDPDPEAYQRVLSDVGLSEVLASLPHGDQTLLDPSLPEGIDLSGGQWQRVAMARTFCRLKPHSICLFDEPTSAIDPLQEQLLFQHILGCTAGQTLIVVGHRMALGQHMDQILILSGGEVQEQGSHRALLARQGLYHQMHEHQRLQFQSG